MEKLRLVENGIFPITKDAEGNALLNLPETGLSVAGTVQGEGKLSGIPVLFIRTAGCNLRCTWELSDGTVSLCDTPFSSFDVRKARDFSVDEIVDTVRNNLGTIKHLVISGGEPMIQKEGLIRLSRELKEQLKVHISIETNATQFYHELDGLVDFYSMSPKLRSSTPDAVKLMNSGFALADNFQLLHERRRLSISAIQNTIDSCNQSGRKSDFQLKFVLSNDRDLKEIEFLLKQLKGWRQEDVLLMPVGRNEKELKLSSQKTLELCLKQGWRYCPRLHIDLFGDKHGV
jgi:7-carboxy-7-deazaguanine synthase